MAAICEVCPLLATKPGQEPAHLTAPIMTAVDLDAIRAAGGAFAYPDTLTAYEWTCLRALQAGRAESELRATKERAAQAETGAEQQRLDQLRRR